MTQVELFDNDEQGKIWQWFDNDKEVKFDNDNEAFAHATFPSTASRPIDLIQNPIWQWSAVIRLTTTTDAFLHFEFKLWVPAKYGVASCKPRPSPTGYYSIIKRHDQFGLASQTQMLLNAQLTFEPSNLPVTIIGQAKRCFYSDSSLVHLVDEG